MTEPTSHLPREMDEELDSIYDGIAYRVTVGDVDEAKARLRRALMYQWMDGHSAGVFSMLPDAPHSVNPWQKTDEA